MKRVAVLGAQVPFVRGGAEILNEELVRQINLYGRKHGLMAELIQLPFKPYPEEQILSDMLSWSLLDLSEANGHKIDLCIGTKFPSYFAQHENKNLWMVHQHRIFYDLQGSEYDVNYVNPECRAIRETIRTADTRTLGAIEKRFSISHTVSERLKTYNDLSSEVIYPPSKLKDLLYFKSYGDYILYFGRLETIKRTDLLVRAIKNIPGRRIVIAGTGNHLKNLQELVVSLNLQDRVTLTGYVSDESLLELIADARAVFYGPLDEDYGFATLEAFGASKPVITFSNSGEVARLVASTASGWVVPPNIDALTHTLEQIFVMEDRQLSDMAEAGKQLCDTITWQAVISNLVENSL